jgi:hypothetical protein
MHIKFPESFGKESGSLEKFQDFAAKLKTMVQPIFQTLMGEEVD